MASNHIPDLQFLLDQNEKWASCIEKKDPYFFPNSATQKQAPKVLWIGCSDSRVPESVITESLPGVIFVHRNIANQFHLNDDSALSVLGYAIGSLNVDHVVVAGHTVCGGVIHAFDIAKGEENSASDPLDRWLASLVELAKPLTSKPASEAVPILIKENIKKQVENIAKTDVIQRAWDSGRKVYIHGWLYHLENGRLSDLGVSLGPE